MTVVFVSLVFVSSVRTETITLQDGTKEQVTVEQVKENGIMVSLHDGSVRLLYKWDQLSPETRREYDPEYRKKSDKRKQELSQSNVFLHNGEHLPDRVVFYKEPEVDAEQVMAGGPHLWKEGILAVFTLPADIQKLNDAIQLSKSSKMESSPPDSEKIYAFCEYPDGNQKKLLYRMSSQGRITHISSASEKRAWQIDSRQISPLYKYFPPLSKVDSFDDIRTGRFKLPLTKKHPCTDAEFAELGGENYKEDYPYDLKKEKCAVAVPSDYDGTEPYGLIVHISPNDGCGVPGWRSAALKRNIICASPAKAGNDQKMMRRARLALDTMATVKSKFQIDPDRIFITGFSGGGRSASEFAFVLPEEFNGVIPVCGVNFYEDVPCSEKPGRHWPGDTDVPSSQVREIRNCRFVLITGTEDFNLVNTRDIANGYTENDIPMKLIVKEGMGHSNASAELMAEALDWIEKKRVKRQEKERRKLKNVLSRTDSMIRRDEHVKAQKILRNTVYHFAYTEQYDKCFSRLKACVKERLDGDQ